MSPPDMLVEVKLSPTRADIVEWLGRVKDAGSGGAFELVYSDKPAGLLFDVQVLIRLAREAHGNSEIFIRLVRAQDVPNAPEILAALGTAAIDTHVHRESSRSISDARG